MFSQYLREPNLLTEREKKKKSPHLNYKANASLFCGKEITMSEKV